MSAGAEVISEPARTRGSSANDDQPKFQLERN
jgi:hypothetical protein